MAPPMMLVAATVLLLLKSPTRASPLSLAEGSTSYHEVEPHGPGTYAWGYDVEDAATGNTHFRQEERHANGTVTGSYGLLQPDGVVRVVHYVADDAGYRSRTEYRQTRSRTSLPSPYPSLYSAENYVFTNQV
ncbi:cuticle protein 18.6-like [Schistocerca cancellata]|uniref:cuticle protein 18.6-like n=1 Tax=Schistocerca cancellata TaxID=274614 RepID=UPI00211815BE|nr:cuticle protein 18.6-like [Schistocerca cancellata]